MVFEITGESLVLKEFFISARAPNCQRISSDHDEKEYKLRTVISSSNMFGETAVRLDGFSKWKKEEKKSIERLLKSIGSSLDVFIDGSIDPGIEKTKVSFELPKPWEEERWIDHGINIASKLQMKATRDSIKRLIEKVGRDELRILSELEKLKAVDRNITAAMIDRYVVKDIEVEVEALVFTFLSCGPEFLSGFDYMRLPFPLFSSVLSKILIETGTVLEHKTAGNSLSWKEVKSLSEATGISTSRISKIVGFNFFGSDRNMDITAMLDRRKIAALLICLQDLDEKFKRGDINQEIAYFALIKSSSQV
jgi:DNA polymerase-3 subunit delta